MMDMPERHIWRFFAESLTEPGEAIPLGEEEARYAKVLRLRIGETVEVTDGRGGLARARVEDVGKKDVTLRLESKVLLPRPTPSVLLFLGPAKMPALESSVESAVELGADHIFLVGLGGKKTALSDQKRSRLMRIATEAFRVAKRTWSCGLDFKVADWPQALRTIESQEAYPLVCDEAPLHDQGFEDRAVKHLNHHEHLLTALQSLGRETSVALLIGPESGFRHSEKQEMIDIVQGSGGRLQFVSLGDNVLTVPNAVAAAVAFTQACRIGKN